jgi:hypothetical protein
VSARKRAPSSVVKLDARPLGWEIGTYLRLVVLSRGRAIAVTVTPVPGVMSWGVVAIETSSGVTSAEQVFDDHAHKIVGQAPGMVAAVAMAQSYAEAWQRARLEGEACLCGEIEPAPVARGGGT